MRYNTNYGYYRYNKYTYCYDNENTYKEKDEFNDSFIRRMNRLNEMNIEGDMDFINDCMDYGDFVGDNYSD